MPKNFLRKIAGLVPLFIGITFISFLVIHLAPGGPVDAASGFNPKMTLAAKEKLNTLYGLDKPVLEQYFHWLKRISFFDFGNSFVDGDKVTVKIGRAVPITLLINSLSLVLVFLVGIPLGILGAVKKDSFLDKFLGTVLLSGFSIPTFWLAMVLIAFFGVFLRVLPVSGIHSLWFEEMSGLERTLDTARHLVLPVLVSSITGFAGIARFMRSRFLEVLSENYIRTARAKGLSEKRVIFHHALRNALIPVVTLLGLSLPGLLGGSVIFETIFSIPGMGRLFFSSVFTRDYPVIMGILVLGAFLTLLGNLLADLSYRKVDPRIQTL